MSGKLFAMMLMVVAAVCSPLSAQPVLSPQLVWGAASDGLRMALSAAAATTSPGNAKFWLAFQNVGSRDALLNLGFLVRGLHAPWAIRLILTDPRGQPREIVYRPTSVWVRGRVDPLVVALPSGGTYILTIDLAQISAYPKLELGPGRYRLEVRFEGKGPEWLNLDTPGIGVWRFWKGIVQSNSVEFQISE